VINFAVIILASWESFAVTFQFALTNGGPASIFYGSILAGIGACAVGFSLAELASMYVSTNRSRLLLISQQRSNRRCSVPLVSQSRSCCPSLLGIITR
jgi:hypothetical protein